MQTKGLTGKGDKLFPLQKYLSMKIEQLETYLETFHSNINSIPPKPDSLPMVDYQIICRLYLLYDELPKKTKVRLYLGDICEDFYQAKTAYTGVLSRLQNWSDCPCLFTQTALLSHYLYDIRVVIGYNTQKEYVSPSTCIVLQRQTPNGQRRFF